jgi:hypothetical protein
MRAGTASAAALRASAVTTRRHPPQHCSEEEYGRFVTTLPIGQAYQNHKIHARRRFVRCWPDLQAWCAAPLGQRIGRIDQEDRQYLTDRISYQARGYLIYLGLQGYLQMDYDWLFGVGHLYVDDVAIKLGRDLGIGPLAEALRQLGFHADVAR